MMKRRILDAGYHNDVSMRDYLSDPCANPSLSTGTVGLLVNKSPLHAHQQHPRFGGREDDPNGRADLGSAIHTAIHGGNAIIYAPQEFSDWRKKEAKAFREEAREADMVPLLWSQRDDVERCAENARNLLATLGSGHHEVTMAWELGRVWCRGRADFLSDLYDVDTKTCSDADPYEWTRRNVYANDLDIQAGLRHLGHIALGKPRIMLWMLVEIKPPYACSLVGVGQSMIDLAVRKINHAEKLWSQCLDSNMWPGYSQLPVWAEAQTHAAFDLEERGI